MIENIPWTMQFLFVRNNRKKETHTTKENLHYRVLIQPYNRNPVRPLLLTISSFYRGPYSVVSLVHVCTPTNFICYGSSYPYESISRSTWKSSYSFFTVYMMIHGLDVSSRLYSDFLILVSGSDYTHSIFSTRFG